MPKQDGTGPMGMGSRTGRGFGSCGLGLGWRKRFGMGCRMGRYFGWRWPQTQKNQVKAIADYRRSLEEELEDVKKEERKFGKDE